MTKKEIQEKVGMSQYKHYMGFSMGAEGNQHKYIEDCVGCSSGMYRHYLSGLFPAPEEWDETVKHNIEILLPIYFKEVGE